MEVSSSPDLTPYCPRYHRAMQIMGPRWTPEIVRALLAAGTLRFGEIRDAVPGLSDRMLSERLRTLEAEGLVTRSVVPARPPRVDYHLTDKGKALASVVTAVGRWADAWLADG